MSAEAAEPMNDDAIAGAPHGAPTAPPGCAPGPSDARVSVAVPAFAGRGAAVDAPRGERS